MIQNGIDETSIEGAANSPYLASIADYQVDLHSPELPIPVLWWRSVGHSHTAFVVESFIDELAHATKKDPVAFRRELLPADSRHRRVLDTAAEAFGWGKPLPAGHAAGIAVHESFESFVAQAAEVSVDPGGGGRIRVHRVVCAIDCGPVINPDGVEAQMQSGIVYGLSAALYGEITLRDGRVEQSNFHDYPVLRLDEMPRIEVRIVRSNDKMGGAGEPGTPPIAPAVANALFALTGKRLRRLPLRPGLKETARCGHSIETSSSLAALLGSVGIGWAASDQDQGAQAEAVQAFGVVQKVLQHPRCQNCHIPGDAPLQFDDGRVHAQNVRRGPEGKGARGLACSTCHSTENPPASYGANMPPERRAGSCRRRSTRWSSSACPGELCRT